MPRAKGPRKVRIPGTNRWVAADAPEAAAALPEPPPVDEFDESGWEAVSTLGPRPEPVARAAVPPQPVGHYYHATMPHLRVKRGRKDALRWRGGVIHYSTAEQEARIRRALAKYVPGGNPDRWKGDSLADDDPDLRCAECGYFTRNVKVWRDHGQMTGHFKA